MPSQTVTRTIESEIEPQRIYAKLTDVQAIPLWAPVFADKVEHVDGITYRITKDGKPFDIELHTNDSARTVDYLRNMADGRRGGAYLRVMERPLGGSVAVMTVPVAPNTTPEQVAAVVEQELQALLKLL
jgi:hypothetical protein